MEIEFNNRVEMCKMETGLHDRVPTMQAKTTSVSDTVKSIKFEARHGHEDGTSERAIECGKIWVQCEKVYQSG